MLNGLEMQQHSSTLTKYTGATRNITHYCDEVFTKFVTKLFLLKQVLKNISIFRLWSFELFYQVLLMSICSIKPETDEILVVLNGLHKLDNQFYELSKRSYL